MSAVHCGSNLFSPSWQTKLLQFEGKAYLHVLPLLSCSLSARAPTDRPAHHLPINSGLPAQELIVFLGRDTEARVPLFRAVEINLHRLFKVVASRGGYLSASGCRAWSWVRSTPLTRTHVQGAPALGGHSSFGIRPQPRLTSAHSSADLFPLHPLSLGFSVVIVLCHRLVLDRSRM